MIDYILEVKDDYGSTMQNIRDKIEVKLSQTTADPMGEGVPSKILRRLHSAAEQVCREASRSRERNRAHPELI